ncbi:MAG: hypothetical protein LBV78_17430, partial [Kitasatospora sp.]|nr:hypothetical protein [Kitasatospora sp.]
MRLRRLAAAGAAATAVVLATTAAVFPSAQVDRPQPLPALTSQALAARYAADSQLIARTARAASRAGHTGLARSLAGLRGHHFIDFNSRGQGLAVEVVPGAEIPPPGLGPLLHRERGEGVHGGPVAERHQQFRRRQPRPR